MKYFTLALVFTLCFFAQTVFAQKGGDRTLPTEPTNFALSDTPFGIHVTWDLPMSDGGVTLDGYVIYYKTTKDEIWVSYQTTEREYDLNDIVFGVEYDVYVTAYNWVGEGTPTKTLSIVVPPSDPHPTEIVSESLTTSSSETTALISWQTNNPATSVVSYDVHPQNQHGENTNNDHVTEHRITITELVPCTTYFFFVSGQDASSQPYSSEVSSFNTIGCVGTSVSEGVGDLTTPERLNEFTFNNSKVDLIAQPGVVQKDSIFQVKKVTLASVDANVGCPAGARPAGDNVYDIKLLDNYDSIANLNAPVTVSFKYEDSDISNLDEDNLSLYHFTEGAGWQKVNSCRVDKSSKTLTCEIQSFSKFMLASEEEPCDEGFFQKIVTSIKTFFTDMKGRFQTLFLQISQRGA